MANTVSYVKTTEQDGVPQQQELGPNRDIHGCNRSCKYPR
jgi:hypothetical protein